MFCSIVQDSRSGEWHQLARRVFQDFTSLGKALSASETQDMERVANAEQWVHMVNAPNTSSVHLMFVHTVSTRLCERVLEGHACMQGLLQAYDSVRAKVMAIADDVFGHEPHTWQACVTGHSLGGALATLCSYELANCRREQLPHA